MDRTTVAKLRPLLADYFDQPYVDTALRVARMVGTIPEGQSGFGGCRSALVDRRAALLVLYALVSGVNPTAAPPHAERIGSFILLRRDDTHSGYEPSSIPYEGKPITLLEYMVSELERGTDPDHLSLGWGFLGEHEPHEAWQADPEHLVFGDGVPIEPHQVLRQMWIPMRLMFDLAGLFAHPAAREDAAA
jgi:hypothetical protein